MTWASKPLGTPSSQMIAEVRTGITVESIATRRDMLVTRQKSEWGKIQTESDLKEFDHVPVTEGYEIVGVFDRESGTLKDLSEAMFLASDSSLLNFVEKADQQKFAFLVRESSIAGIVTLSDIQRLPVYCVLFSLLMTIEMLLMDWIRKSCRNNPEKWIEMLDPGAKARIDRYWQQAQDKNVALDRLSCASFGDELTVAEELGLFSSDSDSRVSLMNLKELRDMVCHGKEFALTPERALEIPVYVRNSLRIQDLLNDALGSLPD